MIPPHTNTAKRDHRWSFMLSLYWLCKRMRDWHEEKNYNTFLWEFSYTLSEFFRIFILFSLALSLGFLYFSWKLIVVVESLYTFCLICSAKWVNMYSSLGWRARWVESQVEKLAYRKKNLILEFRPRRLGKRCVVLCSAFLASHQRINFK